jgi:methionyl-tRNA formyltransferase
MRVVLFANNRIAIDVAEYLRASGSSIAALVLHPPDRRRFGREIQLAAAVGDDAVLDGSRLRDQAVLDDLASRDAAIGVSVLFDYILKPALLALFPRGVVNLHPSYLPFNRGQYPNVWSIVDRTPAGVTLHRVDAGIDTGAVLAQRQVAVRAEDTGETLYRRLEREAVMLFAEAWPRIVDGTLEARAQEGPGTYHRSRDVDAIDEIDLDREYRAGHLLDVLRARTFPPYTGAFFRDGERKIYVRVQLIPEKELEEPV